MSLPQLPWDILRIIMYIVPYESLVHIVKLSRIFRLLIREPRFWYNKTINNFSRYIESEADFQALSGPNDRMRYLDVYRSCLDKVYRVVQDYAKHVRHDPTHYTTINQILADIRTKLDYIWKQRQSRFLPLLLGKRLPKVHYWESIVRKDLSDDLMVDDLIYVGNPNDERTNNVYLVVRSPDDTLTIARSEINEVLPHQAYPMLKRYVIHSQKDLRDLYNITRWRRCELPSGNNNETFKKELRLLYLRIPRDEREYNTVVNGQSHEFNLIH